jgi:hypothetical protein
MKAIKKYIWVVFFLFSTSYSFSQNFISEEKGWSIVIKGCYFREPPCYTTYYYKFLGDTLIGGINYTKLFESHDRNKQIWKIHSFWRENSDSVFAYYEEAGQERLIYNFNLKVGDSIQTFATFKIKVDSIKTLEWGGEMRRHFYLSKNDYSSKTLWIEGVGSMANFIRNSDIGFSGSISTLLCFEENGQQVYQNPEFNSCYVYISSLAPFISEKKVWSDLIKDSFENKWKRTEFYKFNGDSTINNVKFKKLYISSDENREHWSLNSLWLEKDDSIFQLDNITGNYNLIYNFNLEKGDSFFVFNKFYLYVDSVKNVVEWGGDIRKHWYLSNRDKDIYRNTVWIEGVGQTGLMTRPTEIGISGAMCSILCFEENGQQVYQNSEYNSCYINTLSNTELKSQQQLINLISTGEEKLYIKLLRKEFGELVLYSTDGKQLLNQKITSDETELCAPSYGVMLYRFVTEKGEIQTGKVLVK